MKSKFVEEKLNTYGIENWDLVINIIFHIVFLLPFFLNEDVDSNSQGNDQNSYN